MKLRSRMVLSSVLALTIGCNATPTTDSKASAVPSAESPPAAKSPKVSSGSPKELQLKANISKSIYLDGVLEAASIDVMLDMASTEADVPIFWLSLGKSKKLRNKKDPKMSFENLVKLEVSDENCTGEYSSQVSYSAKKWFLKYQFFKDKIPWPQTFTVGINYLEKSDGNFFYEIDVYDEIIKVETYKRVNAIRMVSMMQNAYVSNIKIMEK